MSIIIDIDVAERVFLKSDDDDFCELHSCIFNDNNRIKIKVVYGGRLTIEYQGSYKIFRIIKLLDQAGKAKKEDEEKIDEEMNRLISLNICRSNDQHIIALARVGRVRLISTNDNDLRSDFRNRNIINNPRGNIYQSRTQRHLLERNAD